ncbi:hypothetical protein Drorol1_Dr00009377 [Drosera rotundifolia]
MAAKSSSTRLVFTLGKRFFFAENRHIGGTSSSLRSAAPSLRRSAHNLVYEKNLDEHVTPSAVPDDVIQPQSDKYWEPNPQTGVFGPASEQTGGERGFHSTSPGSADGGGDSVLEQKAFFRPLEDLDKPHHP